MMRKHILVAVTGGIAAYKACDLVSKLSREYDVKVMMTENAEEFVNPVTFAALSHSEVYDSEFHGSDPIPHINLAKWADLLIIAPATANIIAKAVCGIADNLMTSTFLACTCPKILCPAMNEHMLENPVTQHNIELARQYGWVILEPETGHLACMDSGKGRLPETSVMINKIKEVLGESVPAPETEVFEAPENQENPVNIKKSEQPEKPDHPKEDTNIDETEVLYDDALKEIKPLRGLHVLISAGPTQESLDPVRFLSNHSSGKQGYAIAKDAVSWGAEVVLVSGPTALEAPKDVKLISVVSAIDMEKAMNEYASWADFIIMAAAVADYRPVSMADQKIKKSDANLTVEFVKNPDILSELGKKKKSGQVLCGFAMETENLDANARQKLESKNCDLLVANNLTTKGAGFQGDTNVVSLLKPDSIEHLPLQSKEELGYTILADMLEIRKGNKL